jgi:hypothetical protein
LLITFSRHNSLFRNVAKKWLFQKGGEKWKVSIFAFLPFRAFFLSVEAPLKASSINNLGQIQGDQIGRNFAPLGDFYYFQKFFLKMNEVGHTLPWRRGIVVIASAYRRSRVRIPLGCKVFRVLYPLQCCCRN